VPASNVPASNVPASNVPASNVPSNRATSVSALGAQAQYDSTMKVRQACCHTYHADNSYRAVVGQKPKHLCATRPVTGGKDSISACHIVSLSALSALIIACCHSWLTIGKPLPPSSTNCPTTRPRYAVSPVSPP
jgi:hypothetical protein